MITCIDIEYKTTAVYHPDGYKYRDYTPFVADNFLVSIGVYSRPTVREFKEDLCDDNVGYYCFQHSTKEPTPSAFDVIQNELDSTDLLIGHHIKSDLLWLLECGFEYSGALWDTQIAEFVILRGIKKGTSLDALGERYQVVNKKLGELVDDYLKRDVTFDEIPWNTVEAYGKRDVTSTGEIFLQQVEMLQTQENATLLRSFKMMCDFIYPLIEMRRNGFKIDKEELKTIKQDYITEKIELEIQLREIASKVMGDIPIDLGSTKFRSQILFSREIINRRQWLDTFNIGTDKVKYNIKDSVFITLVRGNTRIIHRTTSSICNHCDGMGCIQKKTLTGNHYKKLPKCPECKGAGWLYTPQKEIAGFKLSPSSVQDVGANGFNTNKEALLRLKNKAGGDALIFIEGLMRLSAIDTYLNTFIRSIELRTHDDGILRTEFNQCVTSTFRLSSSGPNMQNQPREKTFPVRKCFVSRFEGGKLLDGDEGQLEFRVAGYLSGCPQVLEDINNGVDVHSRTRDIINEHKSTEKEGLKVIDRQDAKNDTFKPLYGGMSGSKRQVAYYKSFLERYFGVREWHEDLKNEALKTHKIRIPSGREYAFPGARRTNRGYVKESTRIVNYPVQGFATGDMVPLVVLKMYKFMKFTGCKSRLILTVHDDMIVDMHPDEIKSMPAIMKRAFDMLPAMLKEYYDIDFDYPLAVEIKQSITNNWMEMEVIDV